MRNATLEDDFQDSKSTKQRILMASAYCPSCKAKITHADVTCPNCGSPTSRKIIVVLCIAIVIAGLMLYNAYRNSSENNTSKLGGAKTSVAATD